MTRKVKCHSESNSFVAAAEQVCLQPVLLYCDRYFGVKNGKMRSISLWAE